MSLMTPSNGSGSPRSARSQSVVTSSSSVAAGALALALLSLAALPRLTFDDDPLSLRDPDSPSVEAFSMLIADSGQGAPAAQEAEPAAQPASSPAPAAGAGEEASVVVDTAPVDVDALYKVLVAEFAGRRGMLGLSLEYYLDVARRTGDPAVAERAVRIAVYARDKERGLEAARLWAAVAEPDHEARQVYGALLVRAGRLE